MTKLSIIKEQTKITIPREIVKLKGWNKETEIIISPLIIDPKSEIDKDTPIIITEIKKKDGRKK